MLVSRLLPLAEIALLYHGRQVQERSKNKQTKRKVRRLFLPGFNSSSAANIKASSDSSTSYLIFFRWLPVKTFQAMS